MKISPFKAVKINLLFALLISFVAGAQAQQTGSVPAATAYSVASSGPNSRTWERMSYTQSPSGDVITNTQRIVEMASGLNYWNGTAYVASQPSFQLSADRQSFLANRLQYTLKLAANLNTNGSVAIKTPDGIALDTTPIAIALYDPVGSNTLFIGAITNCSGVLVSSNVVGYENCFDGVDADVTYSLDRGSFRQDVILEQDVDPADYGFSSNSLIQIFTEFYGSPTPTATETILRFGQLKFAQGYVYTTATNANGGTPITSAWTEANGRQFLVESVKYSSLQQELQALPKIAARNVRAGQAPHGYAAIPLPHPPGKTAFISQNQHETVKNNNEKGLAMDYVAVVGTETNNPFIFQGDITYFISDALDCSNVVFEGGTVIKFSTNTTAGIEVDGYVSNQTSIYLPAIFTAGDDNSVGQGLDTGIWSGYTGTIRAGGYANPALDLEGPDRNGYQTPVPLENYRFCFAKQACKFNANFNIGVGPCFYDCQFLDCTNGVWCNLLDDSFVLFANCLVVQVNFLAYDSDGEGGNPVYCYDSTMDNCSAIYTCPTGTPGDEVVGVNSIFSGCDLNAGMPWVTNYGSCNGFYDSGGTFGTSAFTDTSPPYQTVGGGNYYLADSTFRGKGTTNIDQTAQNEGVSYFEAGPAILADLERKSTWPPIVYSGTNISSLGTLSPTVPRNTNSSPDLGYCYDALDYVFGGCELNTNLTVTEGTDVGWFQAGSTGPFDPQPFAISMNNGANLSFDGNATQPCYFARYVMVQEGENGNWTDSGYIGGIMFNGNNTNEEPRLFANFTKWTMDTLDFDFIRDNAAYGAGSFNDCEFYSGNISTYDMQYLNFSNCLFFRDYIAFWDQDYALSFNFENCTFYDGGLFYGRYNGDGFNDAGFSSSFWEIENCSFDGTSIHWSDPLDANPTNTLIGCNAYNTNNLSWQTYPEFGVNLGTNEVVSANDIMVANYDWQTSWFGKFYLPGDSPLLQKGSTNAGVLGLYWFTTQTNQVPQSNNVVDIGYHFVATDTNGNPLATLDPPVPNYLLDPTGASNFLTLVTQPASDTVTQGYDATFSVGAGGVPWPAYQWYWGTNALTDGGGISGSESATLNLNGVNPDQAGEYYVVVTNVIGSITSSPALLTVLPFQTKYSYPQYIMSAYDYWNVTDISDPAQPVSIGALQQPFSEPLYSPEVLPQENTFWHTNTTVIVTNAYGTAAYGGSNGYGTVFQIAMPAGTNFIVIHTFNGTGDGAYPCGQLAISGSTFYDITNTLYGTTSGGGTYGLGTVFRVDADGTGFKTLYQFTSTNDGKSPQTGLIIYGTTLYGTTTNSVFRINADGSDFMCLTNLTNASQLILSPSGTALFGTTSNGGAGFGTVFSINTDGSGLTNIYTFTNGIGGAYPMPGLEAYDLYNVIQGGSWTLYGTACCGGQNGYGMVFSVNPDGSGFTDLHDFNSNDGAYPVGGLSITNNSTYNNANSFLFGMTSAGGTNDGGTLFGINLNDNRFTNLFSFAAGVHPMGKLAWVGPELYGTTSSGGIHNAGSVFSVADDGTGFTNLYSFNAGRSGYSPLAGLSLPVVDNLPSIWSLETTINVPAEDVSNLVYSMFMDDNCILFVNSSNIASISSSDGLWQPFVPLTNLHPGENDVKAIIGGNDDGNDYFAMVIEGPVTNTLSVNLFGTASAGGTGYGTLFEILPGGYETKVYNFENVPDGASPIGDLVLSSNTFYGATEYGGANGNGYGNGTVFSFTLGSTNDVILHTFTLTNPFDGAIPVAGMILAGNTLYGTTKNGGLNISSSTSNNGTIFRINTDGSGYETLYSFAGGSIGDGANPQASLVLVSNRLYGTTSGGGANFGGTIFSIGTDGTGYTNLYSFSGSPDGSVPDSGLTVLSNKLYGTTYRGGTNDAGTVFSFTIGETNDAILYNFANKPDGATPEAGLTLSGGTLYGTTYGGGAYGAGIIFSIGADGIGYTNLLSFDSFDSHFAANPKADLLVLSNAVYGVTEFGGAGSYGIIFGVGTNGAGFNDVYDFMGGADGEYPEGGLCSP